VKKINPNGVAALAKDVDYLAEFVDSLENAPILRENLDELQQTVNLMQTDNPDEFYDVATRNKKFGRVDAMNGPKILEKYDPMPKIILFNLSDARQAHTLRTNPYKD
jgi:exocyst complex component 6